MRSEAEGQEVCDIYNLDPAVKNFVFPALALTLN